VQVRDSALPELDPIPQSDTNREWFAEQAERKVAQGNGEMNYAAIEASHTISRLARTSPYYKRNRAHICSFFVRGECTRGDECPYRHEMPESGELSQQNIKDRFHGVNDPVAAKLLRKVGHFPVLEPPVDPEITTLYLGNLPVSITEPEIRDLFYAYGELKLIKVLPEKNCAFVSYTTRDAAELAASKTFDRLSIRDKKVKVDWGRPYPMFPDQLYPLPPPI